MIERWVNRLIYAVMVAGAFYLFIGGAVYFGLV